MAGVSRYNDLFQQERKFISFEYFSKFVHKDTMQLDFDDLVYGNASLSALVVQFPGTKDGLTRFL